MVHFEEYSVDSHYNNLPDLVDASKDYKSRQAATLVDDLISDIFVRHGVQSSIGLTLLHNHFRLNDGDKMVNYGAVAYPWAMGTASEETVRNVYPLAWRFTDGDGIAPYEFGYVQGGSDEPELQTKSLAPFLEELHEVLKAHALTGLFGLRLLDATVAMPGVEFTSGNANITLPREAFAAEEGRNVEALWVFEKSLEGASSEATVYRVCKAYCYLDNKKKHKKKHHSTIRNDTEPILV